MARKSKFRFKKGDRVKLRPNWSEYGRYSDWKKAHERNAIGTIDSVDYNEWDYHLHWVGRDGSKWSGCIKEEAIELAEGTDLTEIYNRLDDLIKKNNA